MKKDWNKQKDSIFLLYSKPSKEIFREHLPKIASFPTAVYDLQACCVLISLG